MRPRAVVAFFIGIGLGVAPMYGPKEPDMICFAGYQDDDVYLVAQENTEQRNNIWVLQSTAIDLASALTSTGTSGTII